MDPHQRTILVVLDGPVLRSDAPALCGRIGVLLDRSRAASVVCDVRAVSDPDVGTVDVLARLQLCCQRRGCRVRLLHASTELRDLLAFTGLAGVVPCLPESVLDEARGQAEQREEPGGVEEERDAADPIA